MYCAYYCSLRNVIRSLDSPGEERVLDGKCRECVYSELSLMWTPEVWPYGMPNITKVKDDCRRIRRYIAREFGMI